MQWFIQQMLYAMGINTRESYDDLVERFYTGVFQPLNAKIQGLEEEIKWLNHLMETSMTPNEKIWEVVNMGEILSYWKEDHLAALKKELENLQLGALVTAPLNPEQSDIGKGPEMAEIKCGACKGTHGTVDLVRACYGLPDKANVVMSDPNKPLIITCGWGNNAHQWKTTRSEAAANGGKCPKCRGQQKA